MKFICPLVVVDNIKKSRYLYESVLGQTVKMDFGENVTFEGDFAIHQREHFQSLIDKRDIIKKSNSFELYFEHDDLADIVNKIKNLNLEFVHEIVEQPWKQQVIRFYDFDKNMIEIGERLEHVAYRLFQQNHSLDEICKITYLDKETVEKAINEYS
ncbi:MAG TPA: glyoxalase/bleomycin resistance/dioxygenase family protein [Spirochaetota bacterium]|nr:glyoxalase/bleomycin resistance/dioxygenase family protein [Spirochaetota bacterium]HOS32315.1 glyoxalase/bleomycin resistance/dioxygenase family protein [Spirochaetota bacterium]HOS54671.1 glyoxalase/bleomycin resistance/dioxygenase family protein [Spirochaetota bacterium]HPK60981.1 glyoxalase/bleomycin resistance/dioxygenase family protein [Spirochaetota bacterium]HQF77309.1 glyoxalase/bleomycin resistance/dioxygenase family protein [Spirochaetota bacterium]